MHYAYAHIYTHVHTGVGFYNGLVQDVSFYTTALTARLVVY